MAQFLLLLTGSISMTYAATSYRVAPGILEFDLSQKKNANSFTVRNNGDTKIRLRITPVYYQVTGGTIADEPESDPKKIKADSLLPFIRFSPRIVTLTPGNERKIRVAFIGKGAMLPGDYRGHLSFKIVKIYNANRKPVVEEQVEGIKTKLSFIINTTVAIAGRVGTPVFDVKGLCAKDQESKFQFALTNQSKWKYVGWLNLYRPDGTILPGSTPKRFIVFPNNTSTFPLTDKAAGRVVLKWGDERNQLNMGQVECQI